MNDNMTDSAWIKANSNRCYRIRRCGVADELGLVATTIVRIDTDRRGWSSRNIRMRAELPDTDDAAAQALQEHESIFAAQLGRVYGKPMTARAVLNKLRQDTADPGTR